MKYLISVPILFVLASCASKKKIEIVTSPKGAEVLVSDRFIRDYKTIGKTPAVLDYKKENIKGEFVYLSVKAKGYDPYNLVIPKKYSMGRIKVKLKSGEKSDNKNDEIIDSKVKRELASVRQRIDDEYKNKIEEMKYNHSRQVQGLNDQLKMAQMLTMNQSNIYRQEKSKLLKELDEKSKRNTQTIFNKTFEIQNALQNKKLSKAGKALAELKLLDPPEGLFLTLEGNFEFLNNRLGKALASYKRALKVDPTNLELTTIVRKLERAVGS